MVGLPAEALLLEEVVVRLIASEAERRRHDQLLERHHYLHNANAVGQVLRYVIEYRGEWVALLTFCSAALHLKPRDRFLQWTARQVCQRRHLIAQNSRFLVLPATGRWPNLASRAIKLVCQRLAGDWQAQFGHPVLLVETFVDPNRFRGTCYKAAGWAVLGPTQGFERCGQDFYLDTQHPKELWVHPLGPQALEQLRATELLPELRVGGPVLPPQPPVKTAQMESLWKYARAQLTDPRRPKGVRHPLASMVCLATLAVAAGCQGPHAIAEFAQSLNHGQRRRLRCYPRRGTRRQFDVPCERTFERLLKIIDADQLRRIYSDWMAGMDPRPLKVLHLDGKVLRNAAPAPARLQEDRALAQAALTVDTPPELQKPKAEKALTLVNFQTPEQRLIDQIAVPQDTNEEAAVAAHLPNLDLAGVLVIADAAHTVKANCRQITQMKGGDYLFFLKGNQPLALAKAQQLLSGSFPPQAQSLDKAHGRIEDRKLWARPVDGATVGLAGAAQIFRIDRKTDIVRKGRVLKTSLLSFYGVTSLWTDEADPQKLWDLVRGYWAIETKQHYRRDHTQREDHCLVRHSVAARNLSLMRSAAIFLYEHQQPKREAKKSLPDWQRKNVRNPNPLIRQLVPPNA